MLLYHGSKAGIDQPIRPVSRSKCDFGRGFYMGTERICREHRREGRFFDEILEAGERL